ncbi:RimJ/RimL family protein N-acetyltransferase [Oikeobacillus pervagus]|uniref:RimJ/RimL family protein N-acetyltransferase n=1 Tax=Oikeobacillus pervagus TaxID=1325931 RepID=A0AAJ1SW82_9BACI|nr:GNAT family N-acetyltransferase [Oikeobacillus pervagus]MDQ0213764.1 RimJ/RimL family protein N-acetyltransferase [Oikeobacillus pervagus]
MSEMMLDFPEKIESDRLFIRPCLPGDGAIVHEVITRCHDHLKPWMDWAQKNQTLEETEENIRKSYAEFILKTDIRLHIFRKKDGQFIGSTGFHRIDWTIPKVEIGYWLDLKHEKNGYMNETVETLTHFAFETLKVNRVEIRCDQNNHSSRKIPERLGYVLEGILRSSALSADGTSLRDICVYSKTRQDFNGK